MNNLLNRKSLMVVVCTTLLTGTTMSAMTGCSDGYRVRAEPYRTIYYDPYDYYYYPNVSVYFHISSGYYHYRDGANWIRARTLPERFYLNDKDRVRIVINSNRPYSKYSDHRVKYAPRTNYQRDNRRNQFERNKNQNRYKQYRRP